jgi:hypothetical protein
MTHEARLLACVPGADRAVDLAADVRELFDER